MSVAPQQWNTCEACGGSGVESYAIWVHEPGCAYGHTSADERPCWECNGTGGWMGEVEPNQ